MERSRAQAQFKGGMISIYMRRKTFWQRAQIGRPERFAALVLLRFAVHFSQTVFHRLRFRLRI
jgi:hypothetical protein